ncbi:MAG: hypothetical protein FWE22_08080 [Firmicutes bacterium]|nr:hypothetical protein [Bacillota bacterium]
MICPICKKEKINKDEVLCVSCFLKRNFSDENISYFRENNICTDCLFKLKEGETEENCTFCDILEERFLRAIGEWPEDKL